MGPLCTRIMPSEVTLVKQETIANAHGLPQVNRIWTKRSRLIAVFMGIQLCVCLKYLQVGLIQVWTKIRGQQVQESSGAGTEAQFNRIACGFPIPSLRRFFSGDFQRAFEHAAQRNFPWSQATLIPLYGDLSAKLADLSLVVVRTRSNTAKPLLGGCILIENRDGERICGPPTFYRSADRSKLLDRRVLLQRFARGLARDTTSMSFQYLQRPIGVSSVVYTGLMQRSILRATATRESSALYSALPLDMLGQAKTARFQDALSRYYRTDHHWNFPGAYQMYRQLWQLLCQRNPQMRQPWMPKGWIELPDVTFYGSKAYRAGCYDAFGDAIVDGIFDLPQLKVRIYGFEGRERHAKCRYQAGHYNRAKFANHYAEYFGDDYGLIEYTCGDVKHGNLLVIGDSFDNCLEPLLASHFSHTWFADLRLYARDVGEEFDMGAFLTQHEITDVLFLGNQYWVVGLRSMDPYLLL